MRAIFHPCNRRHLRERRHVERLPHVLQHLDHVGPRYRIADANSGQPENLRKRPQRDEEPAVVVIFHRVGVVRIAHEFEVRLVGDDHDVLRHALEKTLPFGAPVNRPGRIIGIAEKNNSGVRVASRRHRVEVVRESVESLDHPMLTAGGRGRQRINRERMLRVNRVQSRPQVQEREQVQHLDRARGRKHPLHPDLMIRGDFRAQLVAGAVGVSIQLVQRRLDCLDRARRRPQRILVRRQLHRIVDSELALQLLNRLARLVGSKRGDGRENEILCFDQNRVNGHWKVGLPGSGSGRPTFRIRS